MLTPKNQLADFTRDEWAPSLIEYHEFFDVFLQSFSFIKQAECHVQQSSGNYVFFGSAVAKPRPMNLVSRNFLSAKKTPPQDSSSDPNSPENQELDQSYVSHSVRKLTRDINQNPTMYPQERQQDDTQSSSTRKLRRSDEPSSSASMRKLKQGEDIQFERSKLHFHCVQISDYRHLVLRKKLNLAEDSPVIGIDALKTNALIWWPFVSTTMNAAIRFGPNYSLPSRKIEIAKYARIGEAVPRAVKFGDLITADHTVLNEEGESRNNHRHAVVVQDLATQRIRSYPCKTKTSQGDGKEFTKVSGAVSEGQKSYTLTSHWNLANLVKIYHGIIVLQHSVDPRRTALRKEQYEE